MSPVIGLDKQDRGQYGGPSVRLPASDQ